MTVAALAGPTMALQKVRGFVADMTSGQPLPGVVVCLEAQLEGISAIVGMLISDQAGYVSFALTGPLPPGVQKLCVYPFGDQTQRIDWLPNLGTALHFLLRVSPKLAVPESSRSSLVSIQRPDAVDWELSPYSFASRSSAELGEGSCQVLLPESSAERELNFQRVVRISPPIGDSPPPLPGIVQSVDVRRDIVNDTHSALLKLAQVLEFRQQWFPLGHSLGQVVYSLALAPGESVDIAVIEWSRSDTAVRRDTVTETEQLLHQQTHDRSIEESVNAALSESQGGWSLLGGASTANAASGSATIPIYGIPVNISAAGSMLGAIGGGISQSWGNRNVAADSLQDIHDRVTQATSVYRSLNSTVVVQSTQREQNLVQTRTVVNHNHCHALTVEYYEVLRNFRVRTEFVRRRPVVLVPYSLFAFQWDTALRFRTILENVLLDNSLADCFDAMARLHLCPQIYTQSSTQASTSSAGSSSTGTTSPTPVKQGTFHVYNDTVDTGININAGDTVQLVATGQVDFSPSTFGTAGKHDADGKSEAAPTDGNWPAGGLRKYSLIYKVGSSDWMQGGTNITLPTSHPSGLLVLAPNDDQPNDNKLVDPGAWNVDVWVTPASGSSTTGGSTTSSSAPSQVEDTCCENRLLSHLNGNIGFYSRAIWLLQDALERRVLLDGALSQFPRVREGIEDRPIAVDGNYVAYAWNDPGNEMDDGIPAPMEGIVSLPTRGLFAEAQLGDCNACEVRDVTRFWNWQESPIPESAPAIQSVTPGPKGQPEPVPQPANLPAPVVQISQPLQEPNPLGLAAALSLLGTPNIFRDMSGLTQVSKLLDGLTSGALTLAQAQDMARKAKPQVSAIGSGSGIGGTSAVRPQTPSDLYDKLQVVRNATDQGLLPPSAAQEAAMQYFLSDTTPADGIIQASYTPDATEGITSSSLTPCTNENVTFTLQGVPVSVQVNWSGGGNPSTGTGMTFTTRFGTFGTKSVNAVWATDAGSVSATMNVTVKEPSGPQWEPRWPKSSAVSDLVQPFQGNVESFITALQAAGANVVIDTTLRPRQRAYLMHYAPIVANGNMAPQNVPQEPGVDICWLHRDANGNPDLAESRDAAQQLANAFHVAFPAAFPTRHSLGLAIDMNITWNGNLVITDGNGQQVTITSTPRTGAGNTDLHAVGATYGVIKLLADPPHWSDTGN